MLSQSIDRAGFWWSRRGTVWHLALANAGLGAAQLYMGLLLWMNEAAPGLLPIQLIAWVTTLLAGVPPLLALSRWLRGSVKTRSWPLSTYVAFVIRLVGAASVGLGLSMIYVGTILILLDAERGADRLHPTRVSFRMA